MKRFTFTAVLLVGLSFHLCGRADNTSDTPIGLVLSGGGALGAYEVGVWETLVEMNLANRISVISGTSVGALNAALFASVKAPDKCAEIWRTEVGSAFQFNTNFIAQIGQDEAEKVNRAFKDMERNVEIGIEIQARNQNVKTNELPAENVAAVRRLAYSVAVTRILVQTGKKAFVKMVSDMAKNEKAEGPVSSDALRSMILRTLPEKWPDKAPSVYATAVKKIVHKEKEPEFEQVNFSLNSEPHGRRADILCASACIPYVLGARVIDGDVYCDGGWDSNGGDNVPLKPILDSHPEIKTVIVVYLCDGKKRRKKNEVDASAKGVEIKAISLPKRLGGWSNVFDTSEENIERLIKLGRENAKKYLTDMP